MQGQIPATRLAVLDVAEAELGLICKALLSPPLCLPLLGDAPADGALQALGVYASHASQRHQSWTRRIRSYRIVLWSSGSSSEARNAVRDSVRFSKRRSGGTDMRVLTTWCALSMIFALAGCGGDDDCTPITDTYTLTSERDPTNAGDCPESMSSGSSGPTTLQIFDRGNGRVEIVFVELAGTCTAFAQGCTILTTCELTSPTGETVARLQLDWVLSERGFAGSSSLGVLPGMSAATPKGCTVNFLDVGTRR